MIEFFGVSAVVVDLLEGDSPSSLSAFSFFKKILFHELESSSGMLVRLEKSKMGGSGERGSSFMKKSSGVG